jgi:hypothetical protein
MTDATKGRGHLQFPLGIDHRSIARPISSVGISLATCNSCTDSRHIVVMKRTKKATASPDSEINRGTDNALQSTAPRGYHRKMLVIWRNRVWDLSKIYPDKLAERWFHFATILERVS